MTGDYRSGTQVATITTLGVLLLITLIIILSGA